MSENHTSVGGPKSLPMSVDNVGFLLDRLGEDCAPLQYLRELTQNSIEAIERTGEPGTITWDVDWISYDLGGGPMKLCLTDTGDGMTGEEMQKFINQLSSSGVKQSFSSNYGVGAKIAAATRNPAGVVYQSWKNGDGYMILLDKNLESGNYGLRQWELDDGTFSFHFPMENDVKPDTIDDHGTKVILLGSEPDSSTIEPPKEAAAPSRWISKYLNTRYFTFPENVVVKAREGWDFPRSDKDRNVLRTITGQKRYLDQHCEKSGVHSLEAARVHWWILKDEPAISNNSGFIESAGHAAALYQNELYDRATARAGTAMIQQFGILFGVRFVVLYVEPTPDDPESMTTNTARTTLLLNKDKLPWSDWAYEFRQTMPKELSDFVKSHASAATEKDHLKSIKDRLKNSMDLYKVSRYRPTPEGMYLSDESSSVAVGETPFSGNKPKGGDKSGKTPNMTTKGSRDGEIGNIYHLFEKHGGVPSQKKQIDPFPVVKWVSAKDGTRTEGDMEDKAAKFLADQNTLLVNADFRVYADMVKRLCKEKDSGHGIKIEEVVIDVVHQWFEQALVETVIGVQQLKGSKEWPPDHIERALSSEALTSAVMQRYHVYISCKRELGAKLGKAMSQQ